ncbi:hypothetical protein [Microbacterium sp. NPDC055683]
MTAKQLTPYDTGDRLEPKVWVHEGITSPDGLARPAEDDDYGRVDFDDDEGGTVLTVYVERSARGYVLRVEGRTETSVEVVDPQ